MDKAPAEFPYLFGFGRALAGQEADDLKAVVIGFEKELLAALYGRFAPSDWATSVAYHFQEKPKRMYQTTVTVWRANTAQKDKVSRVATFRLTEQGLKVEMWKYEGPKIGGEWCNPATDYQKTIAAVVSALSEPF